MRRMRNNNLEIMIAGSSCRPQLWLFSPNTSTLSLRDSEAWLQLSKSWIALSTQRISTWETNCVIHSIEIYPSDCTIHLLNNRGKARPIAIAPPSPPRRLPGNARGSPGNQQSKMADPSSRVRSNSEFRERLMEKVQVNVTETGKLAQQLLKSSRSHEVNY